MLKLFLLVCFTVNVFVDSNPLDNAVIEERIFGGNDTDISKFPHQITIAFFERPICGGFIVSPNYIVTKASYFTENDYYFTTIRAGSSSNEEGGEVVKVKKIFFHPKHNPTTMDYNVAVFELATPLKINNKTIKPVKLGTKEPSVGSAVTISGWGAINDHGDEPDTLQYLTIPVVDRTKCANIYKTQNVTVTPRMICAGGEGKSFANNDRGSALIQKDEAVGIAAFFLGYGPWYKLPSDYPGIYTNIADPEILKFIKDTAKL